MSLPYKNRKLFLNQYLLKKILKQILKLSTDYLHAINSWFIIISCQYTFLLYRHHITVILSLQKKVNIIKKRHMQVYSLKVLCLHNSLVAKLVKVSGVIKEEGKPWVQIPLFSKTMTFFCSIDCSVTHPSG